MRRKVIQHGTSTLTVSLPSKWVKTNNIKKGDEIELTENNSNLIIIGKSKIEANKETSISLSINKPLIKRVFVTSYLKGFDIINIHFDSYKIMQFVQESIGLLLGFEIIEQGKNYCKLKKIADSKLEEFDLMFGRMFNVCITILGELKLFLEKNDIEAMNRIILMEDTITRIDLFCRRIINTEANIPRNALGSNYMTIKILENIGDICTDIAKYPNLHIKQKKDCLHIINLILAGFELLRKAKYNYNVELLYEYKKIEDNLQRYWNVKLNANENDLKLINSLKQIAYKLRDLSEEVIL